MSHHPALRQWKWKFASARYLQTCRSVLYSVVAAAAAAVASSARRREQTYAKLFACLHSITRVRAHDDRQQRGSGAGAITIFAVVVPFCKTRSNNIYPPLPVEVPRARWLSRPVEIRVLSPAWKPARSEGNNTIVISAVTTYFKNNSH